MAKQRHVIRRLPPSFEAPVEEQLWPIQIGLVVLGGFLAGIVVSVCDFDDSRPYLNAVTWLTAIPIVVGVSMWMTTRVSQRFMRRAVMLSLVVSLIINLAVVLAMAWARIFSPPWQQEREVAKAKTVEPRVVVPEYILPPLPATNQTQPDFAQPVDTGSTDAVASELTRQTVNDQTVDDLTQANRVTEPLPQAEPHPQHRRERSESPPRRSQDPSQLSHRLTKAQLHVTPSPAQVEPQPSQATPAAQRDVIQPRRTNLARQSNNAAMERPAEDIEAVTRQQAASVQLARKTREDDAQPTADSIPRYHRRVARPTVVPRTATQADQDRPAVAQRTEDEALTPRNTEAARQITTSPLRRSERTRQPEIDVTAEVFARATESPARDAPRFAHTDTPLPGQRQRVTTPPSLDAMVEITRPTVNESAASEVASAVSDTAVTRQQRASDDLQRGLHADELPTRSPAAQTAIAKRRSDTSTPPSIVTRQDAGQLPTRTSRQSPTPLSPSVLSRPAVAETQRPTADPTSEPARAALTRSTGGVAGIGRTQNLDQGVPAAEGRADVASAPARRAQATQSLPAALAVAPSLPARNSRGRADRHAPTASTRAEAIAVASSSGSTTPAELDASASAAVERASSNAAKAAVTAARGQTEVDLGPTRIVGSQQSGRAGGGGQPTLNTETQSRFLNRARVGGADRSALMSTAEAEVPAAPQGAGAPQPAALEANPDASAVVRTRAGGQVPTSTGPSYDRLAGLPSSANSTRGSAPLQTGRAETIEAPRATPSAGGGDRSRRRAAAIQQFVAPTRADTAAVASAERSAGSDDGASLTATGIETSRRAAGLPDIPLDNKVGAAEGRQIADVKPTATRRADAGATSGAAQETYEPTLANTANEGAPLRRSSRTTLDTSATAEVDVDVAAALPTSPIDSPSNDLAGGIDSGPVARQDNGTLPLERTADEGPGGLAVELAANTGFATPRAQIASENLELQRARFVRRQVGGPLTTSARAAVTVDAFRRRRLRRGVARQGGAGQPPPKTEEAIELGLVFLSKYQAPDGRWSLNDFAAGLTDYSHESTSLHSDTAATALSLLAFLGAGYHHLDDKHQDTVRGALAFLTQNQSPTGNLYVADDDLSSRSVAMYSHGIAAIALCEAYGMTQDSDLLEPAQRAVNYIVSSQHPRLGGWRYTPGIESDTSVSGWMLMAMKSGELAGLDVPKDAYDQASRWLDRAQEASDQRHLYRYNPFAPDTPQQRHGLQPTPTITSVGLLMRMYLGWRRDNPWMRQGAEYLLDHPPELGTMRTPKRDTYYWYYATQVMFHMGVLYWQEWNKRLHPLLVETQIPSGPMAGSWNPRLPIPDRWSQHAGRLYVTTMNLLSLEVYYRHLPLYEETAR